MKTEAGCALTRTQQGWLKQIRACEASGKTLRAYAAAQGLEVRTLYAWKKTLVKKGALPRTRPARFQRVEVVTAPSAGDWRIQLPNGVTVGFSGAVDAVSLATVLAGVVALG
jgi:hypothetical protein